MTVPKHAKMRYLHANLRLRSRYGVEVTFDEYLELCSEFRKPNAVRGVRVNDTGNKEGWIQVKGVWACAHYKVKDGLIATFMPAPPDPIDFAQTLLRNTLNWYKARLVDVRGMFVEGDYDRAMSWLKVLSTLPADKYPGNGAEIPAYVQFSVGRELEDRLKYVGKDKGVAP